MMNKKAVLFSLFLLFFLGYAYAIKEVQFNKDRILRTCQCAMCNLQGVDLENFAPGSVDPKKNAFAKLMNGKPGSMYWLSCNFTLANMQQANLSHSNFTVTIRGYVTPLHAAIFKYTNLQQANLQGGKFYGVDFAHANLTQGQLQNATFFLSNFSAANLSHANLVGAQSPVDAMHGWGSDFSRTNFSHANCQNAKLYGNFNRANFTDANCQGATLVMSQSMLTANFSQPNVNPTWEGVNFTGANLKGATIRNPNEKNPKNFQKAYFCHTVMPDGRLNNRDCDKLTQAKVQP